MIQLCCKIFIKSWTISAAVVLIIESAEYHLNAARYAESVHLGQKSQD